MTTPTLDQVKEELMNSLNFDEDEKRGFLTCEKFLADEEVRKQLSVSDKNECAMFGFKAAWMIQQKIIKELRDGLRLAEITLRMNELNAQDEMSDENNEEMFMLIKEGMTLVATRLEDETSEEV